MNFRYSENRSGIRGIDLELSRRSKIALVGVSGCGKSTALHLLAGLYQPDCCELIVDGVERHDLSSIEESVILASQDCELFDNTILYNITFGIDAHQDDLNMVVDTAGLHEVIKALPNGINTDIREKGINLSGGEKQRISLARALYFSRGRDILLLDEITSSVDALNEKLIMEKLINNYGDKCIICSVHRLHLLNMFDTVLVMDKESIVQKGKFSELVNESGLFRELWDKYQAESKWK